MIAIQLDGVQIGFNEAIGPGGVKVQILVATDERSGITIQIPLLPEAQRAIARHLDGKPPIHIANGLPPHPTET